MIVGRENKRLKGMKINKRRIKVQIFKIWRKIWVDCLFVLLILVRFYPSADEINVYKMHYLGY